MGVHLQATELPIRVRRTVRSARSRWMSRRTARGCTTWCAHPQHMCSAPCRLGVATEPGPTCARARRSRRSFKLEGNAARRWAGPSKPRSTCCASSGRGSRTGTRRTASHSTGLTREPCTTSWCTWSFSSTTQGSFVCRAPHLSTNRASSFQTADCLRIPRGR